MLPLEICTMSLTGTVTQPHYTAIAFQISDIVGVEKRVKKHIQFTGLFPSCLTILFLCVFSSANGAGERNNLESDAA